MTRPSRRQLLIWFLAPTLLVGGACVHAYFVAAVNQTPWEGGGFGMFSTVDKRQARFLRCTLITPQDTARIRVPDHLDTYVERLRARPTPARVESLAQYLADATWVKTASDTSSSGSRATRGTAAGPRYRFLAPYETSDRPRASVRAVRVDVWRYQFVRRPYGLKIHRLRSVTRQPSKPPPSE